MRLTEAYPAPVVGYKSGLYYGPSGQLGTGAPPNNTLRCVPLYLPTRRTIDRIGVETTGDGEAGSLVRLGVYDSVPGEAYPGNLLLDAGTVAGDGGAGFKTITINLEVGPGIIWLAVCCQEAATTRPTLRTLNTSDYAGITGTESGSMSGLANAYAQSNVTAALPDTFTSTITNAPGAFPLVRFV